MTFKIPFNKPFLSGKEIDYIKEAFSRGHISGNGHFTKACQNFFQSKYGLAKCLLTSSCTDALEMAAILLNIQPGDEVIVPSYTFVSSANAFVLRGARIVFVDSCNDHPNLDVSSIEALITDKTKAIVVVHYAGVACDMDSILSIAHQNNIWIVEDAAQAIDSFYKSRPLGSLGHLSCFSFHETKNIISGEGGMLVINDPAFEKRAEIIWEKGTNRAAFFRGDVDKYGWVDIGSSFLPSEITAAFLFAQLEQLDTIQTRRMTIWKQYADGLRVLAEKGLVRIPRVPDFATNNAHLFCLVTATRDERSRLIDMLRKEGIYAVFHYQSLHKSSFFEHLHDGRVLQNADLFSDCLLRLPFYYELESVQVDHVIATIKHFYGV